MSDTDLASRFRARGLLFLKGMAMGAADAVPGVSGGTIAFITNIYEELIHSLKSFNPSLLKALERGGLGACWQAVNGNFLLTLLLGILTSLVLLANLVLYLLTHHQQLLMAFFSGLIVASTWVMGGQVQAWRKRQYLYCVAGVLLVLSLELLPVRGGDHGLLYLFMAGAIAICAMILPGISGAFILILLGVYAQVLDALRSFEVTTILVFASGCVLGLLSFSHLLSWLFKQHRDNTLSFLLGVLAGSLVSLWPWKRAVAFRLDSRGLEVPVRHENLWPGDYLAATGQEAMVLPCLLLALVAFFLVYGLEKWATTQP